ncbi:cell-cell cohesion protein MtsF [Hyalangium versicolor]|uniref:cell-cell cohesion protein MtsF n=1 Tax=Hyalangium versicolor TaxID=2861190 RepID=UPI001CCCA6C8|nr:cell-cell cohesion protein MtsF [Hyalangium versicolor]
MSRLPRLLPLASLLLLAACSGDGGDPDPDAGQELPPDLCNNRDEALSQPDCQLTLGQEVQRYISSAGDQDWYSVQIPATANARTLLHINAGYKAQSTAVNLSVNLLRADGSQSSLALKVDNHGQGAPKPVDIILPFTEPNAKLLLLVEDKPAIANRPQFDARSPYSLTVSVQDNPDTHEPNDTQAQATALTLQPQNGVEVATSTGFLATTNDVDRFTFTVPSGKVAYVRLTAAELRPAPPYRLGYTLVRPDGTAEVEGHVSNATIATDLASARKIRSAGTWTMVIQAYRPAGDNNPIEGDLRQEAQYTVEVRVMDEEDSYDSNGDNDALTKAVVQSLGTAPPSSVSFSGRLGYVPDSDWYGVTVPVSTQGTVLYYRLTQGSGGGRFPPLPGLVDREVRVFTQVTKGAAVADRRQNCKADVTACPKGYSEVPSAKGLVEAYCNNSQPEPLCLQASREEAPENFPNLRNFEGTIPVPAHTSAVTYYFLVQDESTDWADDRNYSLQVSWQADSDTESSGPVQLADDSSSTTFPAPPSGAVVLSGQLNYGFGRLQADDRTKGRGVRGPTDYDAVPSDVDSVTLELPPPGAEPLDRTWELQWTVQNLADGGLPHGLALDLTFCDGSRSDGGCTPVNTGSRGGALTLAYRPDPLRAWHSPSGALTGLQPLYSKQVSGGATTFTVLPYACGCLEPRFIKGGSLRMDVSAVERDSYDRVNYTVRSAHTDYPQSYSSDGGTKMCPAPQQDGGALPDGGAGWSSGCRFTLQP